MHIAKTTVVVAIRGSFTPVSLYEVTAGGVEETRVPIMNRAGVTLRTQDKQVLTND